MNYIWCFLGGVAVGGGFGYWLGRRRKKNTVKQYIPLAEEPAKDEKDMNNFVEEEEMKQEYVDVIEESGYGDTDGDESVEDFIGDCEDYLSKFEHPTEDDDDTPMYNPPTGYYTNEDEFYTAKPEYEKLNLVLNMDDGECKLYSEADGDDVTTQLEGSGIVLSELLRRFNENDLVYWRDDNNEVDYEIKMTGGE